MKALPDAAGFFPAFAQAEAEESARRRTAARARQIDDHRAGMRCCWPEWTGPSADDPGTGGFCEVGGLDAYSFTHGERRYHYMAPCRIESVSADGLTVIAVVVYDRPCPCADRYNGERLRLDITEVWPPVWLLSVQRRGQSEAAADAHLTAARLPKEAAA